MVLVLSVVWFMYGAISAVNNLGFCDSPKVFMPTPAPCYDPVTGDIKSYATDCIGTGCGCDISDCPPPLTKDKPANPE